MLTGLLIALLLVTALATTAAGTLIITQRRRQLAGAGRKALPGGNPGGRLLERTIQELRTGDVLVYEGKDFLIEGVVEYEEDGHRWRAGRMVDGGDARWLVVGLERGGTLVARLMDEDDSVEMEGFPPEVLLVGSTRYALDKRGTATARMTGETGLGRSAAAAAGTADRCRWWVYETPGDDTMIVEQWGNAFRVLRGVKVNSGIMDLIPGS